MSAPENTVGPAREQLLLGTFVELADTLVADFDVVEVLWRLVRRCVELFDIAEAGLMLSEPGGTPRVMASSNERSHILEILQLLSEQGPCFECFQSGESVASADLEQEVARWPDFASAALAAGFHSIHALPMRLRGEVFGALNLFRTDQGTLPQADIAAAQALADIATISLVQERTRREAQMMVQQLQTALHNRIVIEQAKGVVAEQAQLAMDGAFSRLRTFARSHNRRLTDVARDVVDGNLHARQLT
jgi:hypothetical protein